ncbi:MAG: glycosyltransferase [Bacteroidota bacterium]|nr:glycosyltransferase [Bacteroidota bacterium]
MAPLDWGLGHATRCIPIIFELLRLNCEVWLAAAGAQETLLKQEFPGLPFLHLPGYNVKYGRSAMGMLWNIFIQSPKILRAIRYENKWLKKIVKEQEFDAVISDNRYGLYHENLPCVFITHQLTIKSPWGKWPERWIQKRNYSYINRFTECWVPDAAGELNLAGDLSHPSKEPLIPVHYTGPLSRFIKTGIPGIKDHLLILLSGPEPQRSIFENKIIKEIAHYPATATIVRGLPGALNLVPSSNSIKFYNHLTAEELNNEMNQAEYIIGRSGYSTIMDIIKLQKKSILVPTPGQTEQEYLAKYLQGKKILASISQNSFSLLSALQSAKLFPYTTTGIEKENNLQQVVSRFVQSVLKH